MNNEMYVRACDGTKFSASSYEVKEYLEKNPQDSVLTAIGEVVREYNEQFYIS